MRTYSENRGTTNVVWRRLAGGLTVSGAVAVALLMALSPAATATSAGVILHNATPIKGQAETTQGCATGHVAKAAISMSSGIAKALMSGSAKTCSKLKGGTSVESATNQQTLVGAIESMKLAKAATNVNITWNIHAALNLATSGTTTHCPTTTYDYSGLFSNGTGFSYGWINESIQACYIEAYVEILAEPSVYDVNTGVTNSSFTSVSFNYTETYYQNETVTENWSNPAWYSMNYSCIACVSNGTFGIAGPGVVSTVASTIIPGSWARGDRLVITAELYIIGEAYIEGASHAVASDSFNGATLGNHIDLTGITVS